MSVDAIWSHLLTLNRRRIERLDDPEVFAWFVATVQQLVREGHELCSRVELLAELQRQEWSDELSARLVAAFEAVRVFEVDPAANGSERADPVATRDDPE